MSDGGRSHGFSAEDESFRQEVCRFLETHLTEELRAVGRATTGVFTPEPLARPWHRILFRKGWIAPSWPVEYGGTGWSVVQQYIFASELARAEAPSLAAMSLRMVGPVLQRFGTPEQKTFYLPRILSGDDFWCQGYSEPGAGSDLASLQLRAVSDGDSYILQGSKIWTTQAQWANRIFCLVRTSNEGKPQQGITFLLVDMDTPGITVKPIITLAGEHEVNEVFFDGVRVPKVNRLGDEGGGWTVAKVLLEFERGGAQAALLCAHFDKLRDAIGDSCLHLPSDESERWAVRLAALEIELAAYEAFERRMIAALSRGNEIGPVSSILKLRASELLQDITTLALDFFASEIFRGADSSAFESNSNVAQYRQAVAPRYLNARAWTIFGGTSEVQRQLIARTFLGL